MPLFRRFWPVLLLALLPLVPLWRCVFLGDAIGPFDQIRQMSPWNGPKPSQPWDVLQADGVLQFYPWRDMVFKAWSHGQPPLWNPYELGGTPLLANSQSAGLYPPHIAMGVLHVPTPLAMTLLAWFHLFWAGLGVYWLARRFGATKEGAVIAGASFQLSAFMLAWTALPSVISTVAWIPWLLGGIKVLCSVSERTSKSMFAAWVVTALSTGMMFLAGHLQFAAYGCLAATFLGAWTLCAEGPRKALVPACLSLFAVMAGFLIAAPQLLPVLNYSQFSHRRNSPTEQGYTAYVAGGIRPFELANLANAYTLGSPRTPVQLGSTTIGAYWPAFEKQGANLAESAVTIGPLVVGLLALLPWRRRQFWCLAALGLIALFLALGTVLNWPLYFFVPGWSATGSPGRIIVLFVMSACVVGGTAVPKEGDSVSKTQRNVAIAAPFLFGLLCLLASQGGASEDMASLASAAFSAAVVPAVVGGLIGSLGIALVILPPLAKYRPALVAFPLLLAWLGYASDIVPSGRPLEIQPATSFDRVAYVNKEWSLHIAAPVIAPPNTAYLLGKHEIAGYDSLLHRDTDALLKDIDGSDPAPPANGNMMFVKPDADEHKLADAGVTAILTRNPDGSVESRSIDGNGRVLSPQGKGEVVEESFSKLVVRATGPGRLVVRDRNMPGWLAKVDGKHVPIEGSLWQEIDLPAGVHTVEFNYVPPGLMAGLAAAFLGWLAILLGLVYWRKAKA
ncbi:MAG TPA: hypothetical protein VHE55_14795 [Fimbriimonadaceae bacterium]|nr:hypothetical protein [Fimbriimonadaceae bacterium]